MRPRAIAPPKARPSVSWLGQSRLVSSAGKSCAFPSWALLSATSAALQAIPTAMPATQPRAPRASSASFVKLALVSPALAGWSRSGISRASQGTKRWSMTSPGQSEDDRREEEIAPAHRVDECAGNRAGHGPSQRKYAREERELGGAEAFLGQPQEQHAEGSVSHARRHRLPRHGGPHQGAIHADLGHERVAQPCARLQKSEQPERSANPEGRREDSPCQGSGDDAGQAYGSAGHPDIDWVVACLDEEGTDQRDD